MKAMLLVVFKYQKKISHADSFWHDGKRVKKRRNLNSPASPRIHISGNYVPKAFFDYCSYYILCTAQSSYQNDWKAN